MSDPKQYVTDIIYGRWKSQIVYNGVKLGIFDAINTGKRNSEEIARELELNPVLTYRLMRALASLGMLKEHDNWKFSLTREGEYLRKDHPESLHGVTLLEEGPEHYAIWKHLGEIIRDGKQDGFLREFGYPVFEYTAVEPRYRAIFNDAMSSFSRGETAMVLDALSDYDFSDISQICDIGGGHGHLLCHLIRKYPHIKGTVFDLSNVFEKEEMLWANRLDLEDRCEYLAGDMFEEVPKADAYIMKHILHDWNDEECKRILSNMQKASAAGAKVFVAEFIVPGPDNPHFAKFFDIHMMCATSGQERTEEEYAELFEKSGWKHIGTWYPSQGIMGVVGAEKG